MPEVEPDADGEQRRLQGKTVVIDGLVSRPDLHFVVQDFACILFGNQLV